MFGYALCELLTFKLCEFENTSSLRLRFFSQKMGRTNYVFGTFETKKFSVIEPKVTT